jgi:hypothetical protein
MCKLLCPALYLYCGVKSNMRSKISKKDTPLILEFCATFQLPSIGSTQ